MMTVFSTICLLLLYTPFVACQTSSTGPSLEEKIIIAVVLGVVIGTALGFSFCFWYRHFRYGRMGAKHGRFRDTYAYDKNDERLRSKYETYYHNYSDGYGRDRSYDEGRRQKYDEKPGKYWGKVVIIRKGEPENPTHTPHKIIPKDETDSKALVPYDNRSSRFREYDNRKIKYHRNVYSDNYSNGSISRYDDRRMINEAPAYSRGVIRSNAVPPIKEIREVERPIETRYVSSPVVREIIENPINETVQKEIVYIQQPERPAQTERIYEESGGRPGYITTRIIESNTVPPTGSSSVIYGQQPQASLSATRLIREDGVMERSASEPLYTGREFIRHTASNDPYIVYSPARNRRSARPTSKEISNEATGYSGFLSKTNYLGTRNDGGISTLFRSGRDYNLGKSNWGFM